MAKGAACAAADTVEKTMPSSSRASVGRKPLAASSDAMRSATSAVTAMRWLPPMSRVSSSGACISAWMMMSRTTNG
jgi:hypothetical protein